MASGGMSAHAQGLPAAGPGCPMDKAGLECTAGLRLAAGPVGHRDSLHALSRGLNRHQYRGINLEKNNVP